MKQRKNVASPPGRRRLLFLWCVFVVCIHLASVAPAFAADQALDFSGLVYRRGDIALTADPQRERQQLQRMFREHGSKTTLLAPASVERNPIRLSGEVTTLQCDGDPNQKNKAVNCIFGVEWSLSLWGETLYRARTYADVTQPTTGQSNLLLVPLVNAVAKQLGAKPRFWTTLDSIEQELSEQSAFPSANLKTCTQPPVSVSVDADRSLNAVVILESGDKKFGSGFVISDDGYILTAAHVVDSGEIKVTYRNGSSSLASVVRADQRSDSALLRVQAPPAEATCLPLANSAALRVGSDAIAVGSPRSKELGFSVSRGIVSGVRVLRGLRQIQTDASINQGNSGGPLLSANGEALGIISWKLAGEAVEGLGFAVASSDVLARLGLILTKTTSSALAKALPMTMEGRQLGAFEEPSPVAPQLGGAQQAYEAQFRAKKRELTPVLVPILRWGGLAVAVAGATGIVVSTVMYDKHEMTVDSYKTARLINDISWVAAGVGVAGFGLSFVFVPSDKKVKQALDEVALEITSQQVSIGGKF